ncbi:hypothetical protein, partial [Klebsiella pneumoniae]
RKESVSTDAELRKQIISRFISPELWPIVYFIKDTGNYHQRYIYSSQQKAFIIVNMNLSTTLNKTRHFI